MVNGHMVAVRTALSGQSPQMFYPVLDHLGSMAALIDGNMLTVTGQTNPNYSLAVTRYSYDAFGMARDPVNWTPLDCTKGPQPPFVRGFTSQEHLPDNVCLINFNARMYDEQIGRFLSADPTIEAIYNGQDLNRYSYVLNNPLALTDPSGYGGFFNSMMFRALAGIAAAALMEYELLPLIEGTSFGALTASAGLAAQAGTVNTATFTLAANAGISGGVAGAVSSGTLKGALLGGAEALAFYGVGSFLQTEGSSLVFDSPTATAALAHGMVGGMFSIGQKGGFVSGFVAASMSSSDNSSGADAQIAGDVVEHAVAGGVGAVLGGGKFANGAVTGSFGYLFNSLAHAWAGTQATYALGDVLNQRDGGIWKVNSSFWGMLFGRADLINSVTHEVYEIKTNMCLQDAACSTYASKQLNSYVEDSLRSGNGALQLGSSSTVFEGSSTITATGSTMGIPTNFIYSPFGSQQSGLIGYDRNVDEWWEHEVFKSWKSRSGPYVAPMPGFEFALP